MKKGYVYVLSNPAMPGYFKVGETKYHPNEQRVKGLDNTSVPLPFELEYFVHVADRKATEAATHDFLDKYRTRPRREFFSKGGISRGDVMRAVDKCANVRRKSGGLGWIWIALVVVLGAGVYIYIRHPVLVPDLSGIGVKILGYIKGD